MNTFTYKGPGPVAQGTTRELRSAGVSVVLGAYNRLSFLKRTIASVRKERECCPFPLEIIVVDGGSTDGTLRWLARQKDIITIIQHNRGTWHGRKIVRRAWGYFMNLGFKTAQGKYICMISDDCLIIPGAIANGYEDIEQARAKGEPAAAIAFFWNDWPVDEKFKVGLTLGGKLLVNHGMYLKEALATVGYIDKDSYFFYHADGDLCLKLWHTGYTIIEGRRSFIEHYSDANIAVRKSNTPSQKQDHQNFLKKWQGIFPELRPGEPNAIELEYTPPASVTRTLCMYRAFDKDFYLSHIKHFIKRLFRAD